MVDKKQHFIQIQIILNKIGKDKELAEKFKKIESLNGRFDFTVDICKKQSLEADYTLDEFTTCQIIISIFTELSQNKKFSDRFISTTNIDDLYDLVYELITSEKLDIEINKEDLETFLDAIAANKKILTENDLESVSGGKSAAKKFLSKSLFLQSMYDMGLKWGELIYTLANM